MVHNFLFVISNFYFLLVVFILTVIFIHTLFLIFFMLLVVFYSYDCFSSFSCQGFTFTFLMLGFHFTFSMYFVPFFWLFLLMRLFLIFFMLDFHFYVFHAKVSLTDCFGSCTVCLWEKFPICMLSLAVSISPFSGCLAWLFQ